MQPSGDTSSRVNRVYCWAGKAASESMRVWMPRTSRSDVSVSDMLGGEYVRSCEQDVPYLWRSHELREWLVQCHGIRVVSCLECLETERSSGRPIGTISKCYETCFRWWCGSRSSWQWLSNLEQLCFRGWISRRVRGMEKSNYARESMLQRAKAI